MTATGPVKERPKIRTGRRPVGEMDQPRDQIVSFLVTADEKKLIDDMSEKMRLTRSGMLAKIATIFAAGVQSDKQCRESNAQLSDLLRRCRQAFKTAKK